MPVSRHTLLFIFPRSLLVLLFFFNDTATTEIYTLSLHDALPISGLPKSPGLRRPRRFQRVRLRHRAVPLMETAPCEAPDRSEEHTSELQSPDHLVCRLLLEKKKKHILSTYRNGQHLYLAGFIA